MCKFGAVRVLAERLLGIAGAQFYALRFDVSEILPFEYRGFGLSGPMLCVGPSFKGFRYGGLVLDSYFDAP